MSKPGMRSYVIVAMLVVFGVRFSNADVTSGLYDALFEDDELYDDQFYDSSLEQLAVCGVALFDDVVSFVSDVADIVDISVAEMYRLHRQGRLVHSGLHHNPAFIKRLTSKLKPGDTCKLLLTLKERFADTMASSKCHSTQSMHDLMDSLVGKFIVALGNMLQVTCVDYAKEIEDNQLCIADKLDEGVDILKRIDVHCMSTFKSEVVSSLLTGRLCSSIDKALECSAQIMEMYCGDDIGRVTSEVSRTFLNDIGCSTGDDSAVFDIVELLKSVNLIKRAFIYSAIHDEAAWQRISKRFQMDRQDL